jgi:hypothetical protein
VAEPQPERSSEAVGHDMILPDNDFARNGSGKTICGQNDPEFAQLARVLTVCSAQNDPF